MAIYLVTTVEGAQLIAATGAELMADGITIDGSPESASHVLLLQPIQLGSQ